MTKNNRPACDVPVGQTDIDTEKVRVTSQRDIPAMTQKYPAV